MIIFYNHFHNGDVHYSREFVKDIIKKTNHDKYFYQHKNKKLLNDLDLIETNLLDRNQKETLVSINDKIYINTWIGNFLNWGCTLYGNYQLYKEVYKYLDIKIEPIDYYVPTIDYEKFKIINIKKYLNGNHKKKILISNGNTESGQSTNFDFTNIIQRLSDDYKNIDFILTKKTNILNDNVIFTDDMIGTQSDLNEISYLSTFCDIIVGRASGPYTFSHVKENIFNKHKKFIDFSSSESYTLWFGSDNYTKSEKIVNYDSKYTGNIEEAYQLIKKNIEKL